MLTGDNGILTQAQNAKKETERASIIKYNRAGKIRHIRKANSKWKWRYNSRRIRGNTKKIFFK